MAEQIAFMCCFNDACKGEGPWFTDTGDREWFVYENDPRDDPWRCPECNQLGTRYPY